MQLLTFRLNGISFGIPIEDVEAILTNEAVTAVPGQLPNIRGIMNLQGEVIAVYNLARRFGYEELKVENLLVVNVSGRKIAIEVEQVNTILDVERKNVIPMPEIIMQSQKCFHDVASNNSELIVLLDVKQLVPADEWESLRKIADENSERKSIAET